MDQEIEFKLLVAPDVDPVTIIEQQLQPQWDKACHQGAADLFNVYYDTPDKQLRQWGIGLRVRGRDGVFEQTIKTDGNSEGGLHQRPEYNVAIEQQQPDLALFESGIFPPEADVDALQAQLQPLFTTHFHRQEYQLLPSANTEVELVVDKGNVKANDHQQPINEIEIELKQGQVAPLFELACQLAGHMPLRIGVLSKAARGYMLAEGKELKAQPLPNFLPLSQGDALEQAFIRALQLGIGHWLHHEQCYQDTGSVKALRGIWTGINLTQQALTLFLPALQCEPLLQLHRQLQSLAESWRWVDALTAIKALKSSKGPFRKSIRKSVSMQSYLRGRLEGLLRTYQPETLIADSDKVHLQIRLSELAYSRPWRDNDTAWQNEVQTHARGWLAQAWANATDAIASNDSFNTDSYMACEPALRQMLYHGLFLGDLFSPEARKQFRAPWLDILDGIEELKVFVLLQEELQVAEVEEKDELLDSAQHKQAHLLAVMEQSRQEVLKSEPYWDE
ncbi:Triphosphatase [Saliniradius amylolyticus]|uniref:Triphosphatase n=2 Tax=Saliniradius amylolyticus TaxID=2183582 RepID=A0A2S2E1Y8_9ALTE|nr:Triphosphatase [Saliniradius amylolyticus]